VDYLNCVFSAFYRGGHLFRWIQRGVPAGNFISPRVHPRPRGGGAVPVPVPVPHAHRYMVLHVNSTLNPHPVACHTPTGNYILSWNNYIVENLHGHEMRGAGGLRPQNMLYLDRLELESSPLSTSACSPVEPVKLKIPLQSPLGLVSGRLVCNTIDNCVKNNISSSQEHRPRVGAIKAQVVGGYFTCCQPLQHICASQAATPWRPCQSSCNQVKELNYMPKVFGLKTYDRSKLESQ
jgi:hypothetical protein